MAGETMRETAAITALLLSRQALYRRAVLAHEEACIKALLGMWVSELPPTIVTGPLGKVVGLGYGRDLIIRREDLP